jgi:pectate lyase
MRRCVFSAFLLAFAASCVAASGEDGDVRSNGDPGTGGSAADGGGASTSATTAGQGGTSMTGSGGTGSAGGSGGGGQAPDPGCESYPYSADALYAELVGFGESATGGDPATPYHVTTLASSGAGSLANALESSEPYWIVFDVNGKITLPGGKVSMESHKTIDGRGRDITIEGTLEIRDEKNIIVSDVALTNDLEGHCTQAGDVISVRGNGTTPESYTARNLWFHHLELYNGGDGLLDLRGASLVTISWTHFHTHKKAMLMGPNSDQSPANGMRVTLHHNFFDRVTLRGPQFLFGWAHYFNNYQLEWYEYGAGSLDGAEFYSENNIYQARPGTYCLQSCPDINPCGDNDFAVSKDGLVHEWSTNGAGSAKSVGDLALEGAELNENDPGGVFDPTTQYTYTAEIATVGLAQAVGDGAGPRLDFCQ